MNFIRDNWVSIALTWNGSSENYSVDINDISYFKNSMIPPYKGWSCYYAAELILDVYNLPQVNEDKYTKIYDINKFIYDFTPGHVYIFVISNHTFTVIYDHNGKIFYVDYYMETGRGCEESDTDLCNYDAFRIEEVDSNVIIKYLSSYLDENFDYFSKFNKGNEEFKQEYTESYYQAKELQIDGLNFYVLSYYKYSFNAPPTICSVVETVISHPPTDDLVDDSVTEINNNPGYRINKAYLIHVYYAILDHLKSFCLEKHSFSSDS